MAVVTRSRNAQSRGTASDVEGSASIYRASTSSGSSTSTKAPSFIEHSAGHRESNPILLAAEQSLAKPRISMPKRKIRQAGVTSAANGSRKASFPESSNSNSNSNSNASNGEHHFESLRRVIGSTSSRSRARSSSDASSKQRHSRPCPPITVQTKDISWPMGSGGDRDSPRVDEYDFISSRDLRPSSATVGGSFERHLESHPSTQYSSKSVGHHSGSRVGAFPLSSQRAMTVSKNRQHQLPLIRTRRAGTAEDSLDGITATTASYTAVQLPHSASASVAAFDAAPATVHMHRSYSDDLSPLPLSPSTPMSAFSYVSVHSPISLKSPSKAAFSDTGGRLRRAGTISGLSSPATSRAVHSGSALTKPPTSSRRTSHLHSSYNSLVLTNSTASTVVSSSSSLNSSNRPTSLDSVIAGSGGGGSRASSSSKRTPKKPLTDDDELRGTPPRDDWDIVFDRIKEYRATHEAPVDTVGCEALTAEEKDPKMQRFRSLISLMLSAQTKDEITAEAVRNLSQRLPTGLTPKSLSEASMDLIHECVRRVGFWQRKSNYIKEAARVCLEQYDADIPRTVPQLLSLPGVGPKMAYLVMHAAWQDNQGIGVDTHVLRISHRLGWVPETAKTPEATRHSLESWMPKSLWREINPLLVGLGQTICRGVGPKCGECPVSQYCPSVQLKASGSVRGSRKGSVQISQDATSSESTELGDVDVEDLASMVRGAEQAVRSRKGSGGRSRRGIVVKTEFPEIPDSPFPSGRSADIADGTTSDGYRARARSRAYSRRYLRPLKMPFLQDGADAGSASHMSATDDNDSDSSRPAVKREAGTTPATSPYFMRSRSNAASEEVRPEAKTATVRSARAKATAKKLYSRRLSKSDMQWALGEDWDPEGSSSMSDSDFVDEKPRPRSRPEQ
ncbi:alpha,alpha-trehalase nth1 [Coemansia erecta]|uniref:Endonuclease III homolog n=1 Tax=Coemansia erecta TaxID=147472 RepID=A0A9W7Y286_9FUNG|nr:alpha,alpha-trehalase nth1 [Coemansia erecta]